MSGLAGVMMAAMLCDSGVDVYGFDTGVEAAGTPYHYYDEVHPNTRWDGVDDSKIMLLNLTAAERGCIRLMD